MTPLAASFAKVAEALRDYSDLQGDAAVYESEKKSELALLELEKIAAGQHFGCVLCFGGTADVYGHNEVCEEVRRELLEAIRK